MNWLTYQLSRTRCLIAHLFQRPDLARLNVIEGELYRLRIRIGDRTVALHRAEARAKYLEDLLKDTLHDRLTQQCHEAHRNTP